MKEQPIKQVYMAPIGPVKSKLIIIGIPVRSHDTRLYSGKGMSNGGPGIISNTAERAPSMLANASFLVSSLCNGVSPSEYVC